MINLGNFSHTKKISLCFVLSIFVCFEQLFAFDFGLLATNDSTFKSFSENSTSFNQRNEVSAWIKIPFGDSRTHYLITEGLYRFEHDSFSKLDYNYIDFSLFKYAISFDVKDNTLGFNLGRFFSADLTSVIYAQNGDGLLFTFENDFFNVQVGSFYSGLLNANITTMLDADDFSSIDSTKIYSLADKYLNTMATISFFDLFASQSISVQGIASLRLAGTPYNRFYGTVGLSGPIYGNLMYSLSGTAGIKSSNNKTQVSPFVKGTLSYYFSNCAINLNAIYAGNDFTGITSMQAYNSYLEPEYTDLLKTGLSVFYKPFEIILLSGGTDFIFDTKTNCNFKGLQYNIGLDAQVASDVSLSVSWIQYIDSSRTDENYQAIYLKAKISL